MQWKRSWQSDQWNGVEGGNLRKRALQSCESVTWAQSSPFTRPSIPTFFLAGPGRVGFSRDFFEVAPNQGAPPPVASRWITGKHGLHLPPHLQPSCHLKKLFNCNQCIFSNFKQAVWGNTAPWIICIATTCHMIHNKKKKTFWLQPGSAKSCHCRQIM